MFNARPSYQLLRADCQGFVGGGLMNKFASLSRNHILYVTTMTAAEFHRFLSRKSGDERSGGGAMKETETYIFLIIL